MPELGRRLRAMSAVAVAVLAAFVIGDRSRAAVGPVRAASCAHGLNLASPPGERSVPALVTVARGAIDGYRWRLRLIAGLGIGRFILGPHSYVACLDDVELIDASPHGILYGLIASPGVHSVYLAHVPGASPPTLRQVRAGTFFVQALPKSACAYRRLVLVMNTTSSGALAVLNFARPCRAGALVPGGGHGLGATNTLPIQPPAGLSAAHRAEFLTGRTVIGETGCLACHRIGTAGNSGPGPNLTNIGSALAPSAIRSSIVNATPPMPSFRDLPRGKLRALVYFLSQLQ
jgi:mono/diheme cytochrome c family protein